MIFESIFCFDKILKLYPLIPYYYLLFTFYLGFASISVFFDIPFFPTDKCLTKFLGMSACYFDKSNQRPVVQKMIFAPTTQGRMILSVLS